MCTITEQWESLYIKVTLNYQKLENFMYQNTFTYAMMKTEISILFVFY